MSTAKSFATIFTVVACAMALSIDAGAQSRGGGGSHGGGGSRGGSSGGGHASSAGRPASQGGGHATAAPRSGGYNGTTRGGVAYGHPVYGNGGHPGYAYGRYPYYGYGRYPYYGYGRYPYYAYGYPYYGYPYYGYPYYGYPGFSVGFSIGASYPVYAAPYGYAAPTGYAEVGGSAAYGGIRIEGASPNAEVFVDGNSAGVVDSYDGAFQRLDLQPGSHTVEIRTAGGGRPMVYDVNITPGHTITIHANIR